MRLSIPLATLALVVVGCDTAAPEATADAKPEFVAVCHLDAEAGTLRPTDVPMPALGPHLAHGDFQIGVPIEPLGFFAYDESCQLTFALNATLEQLSPISVVHEAAPMNGTGVGEVTGTVIPVDIDLVDLDNTSACEASDFDGLDFTGPSDIALIQRSFVSGDICTFQTKALNAIDAGAEAVVIFNQGTEGRTGLVNGTLAVDAPVSVPIVFTTFDAGVALSATAAPGSTARVTVEPKDLTAPSAASARRIAGLCSEGGQPNAEQGAAR